MTDYYISSINKTFFLSGSLIYHTNNSGSIKTTRTWYEGPIKCRSFDSTINITPSWPVAIFSSGPVRNTNKGVACIMPDGRVMLKKF